MTPVAAENCKQQNVELQEDAAVIARGLPAGSREAGAGRPPGRERSGKPG